jgi:hypothetical protein
MMWVRHKTPQTPPIVTVYACGHEQAENTLNLTGRGWCDACQADQPVITTQTGWM